MQLDDLVILAKVSHPIPFRTRTLNPLALMVLRLKARESKSLPDLLTAYSFCLCLLFFICPCSFARASFFLNLYISPAVPLSSRLFGLLLAFLFYY